MRIIVMGYHNVGYACLRHLLQIGENVVAVVSHQDDPQENIWYNSVSDLARRFGIPTFIPEDPNTSEFVETVKSFKPDILFSFYYRKMIKQNILEQFPAGCINLHGSLLPRYRGRAPVNWVLVNGEKETGVTLHHMDLKPDAGDIISQKKILISPEDTALTLYEKVVEAAERLLSDTWPLIKSYTAPRWPQDQTRATYFGGRKPEDGKISWDRSAVEINNLVRAVTYPYPGAFTTIRGNRIYVWASSVSNSKVKESVVVPGSVLELCQEGILVSTGRGGLLLTSVQVEQRAKYEGRGMSEYLKIKKGERLGT